MAHRKVHVTVKFPHKGNAIFCKNRAELLAFLFQSAVEPFIEILEYPTTKGTTPV